MEETKKEKRARKKAYRKAYRRAVRPFKGFMILFLILSLILCPVYYALSMFDNTLAAYAGGSFWKLKHEDKSAQYYESDFASTEELVDYGLELAKQVEAEGAALLMNENNALPLESGAKVSLFSNSSTNIVYGGTGSGNVDASSADSLKTALEKTGISVNETLWNFYETDMADYARAAGSTVSLTAATISEVPVSEYTDEVKDSVKDYGDAAIVVISRVGGEGADLTYEEGNNYLELNDDERDMMSMVKQMKSEGTVKKIIVLINSANALQVDFLKDNIYDVDSVLWIGDVGISGINAVAEILAGEVNPSGSLVDTYCYDNYSSPAMQNFTPITYEGNTAAIPGSADTYMIYQEGIYVGYKYYETRYEDSVMGTGNAGAFTYSNEVAFPFGYGLSYTDFSYSGMKVKYNKSTDQFEITLKVKNTGKEYSGKETVQIYAQSPYTEYDKENGVEKASVNLVGFAKTGELAPGESEELTIYVDKRELASYDAYGAGTYILDKGEYFLTAATDSHNAVNNILSYKEYTDTDGKGDASLVYSWTNSKFDDTTYAVSLNGTEITNRLSDSDINLYEGADGQTVTYLSRSDWEGTFPDKDDPVQLTLTDTMISDLQLVQYEENKADYEGTVTEMPTLGADNGMTLYDMIGLDYDDPAWDDLLDELTFNEMVSLIGDSFHWTMPVESIQAPGTRDENGPQGLTASLFSGRKSMKATAFTSEDVMAATFNVDIMTEIGKVIGNDCLADDVTILYGPGNNIHRTPYGGRNFEYYSEDGFLSGEMSSYEVAAIEAKGVHVVMKHFALNDCEQDRIGLGVWLTEQTARELYLKAFQAPFEKGNAGGTMVAYTRWGCTWSGGNEGLMTGIMRGEWGSNGLTITDNVLTQYVNGVDGVMAGGVTTFDAMLWYITSQLPDYEDDPVVVAAMKEACHHDLYAIANSSAMNGIGENTTVKAVTPMAIVLLRIAAIASVVLFLFNLVMFIIRKRKFRKNYTYSR